MGRVTARFTEELSLSLSIQFSGMAAHRTHPRSVSRINRVQLDAVPFRLVFKKVSKLIERPITKFCPLRFSNRQSFSDVLQIFDSQRTVCAFSVQDKTLTNAVIFVALKAGLPARQVTKFALGRLGLLALQIAPAMSVGAATILYRCTAHYFGVGCGADINDAKVTANHVIATKHGRRFNVAHSVQVKVAAAIKQIRFALAERQEFPLILAALKRDCLPSCKCPDANKVRLLESQDTVIVGNAAVLLKASLLFLINLVSIGYFRNTPHQHLRRKFKAFFGGMLDKFMQVVLLERFGCEALLTNPITSLIRPLQGGAQRSGLFFGRSKFEIHNQFHGCMIARFFKYGTLSSSCNEAPPAPMPKRMGKGVRVWLYEVY